MDNSILMKLYSACQDYYAYVDREKYQPSKKVQQKIMKKHAVDEHYYPLDESCQKLENILENHRDVYR